MNDKLDAERLKEFVDAVFMALPVDVPYNTLLQSSTYLANMPKVSYEEIRTYAWRLAGNIERLQAGQVVLPWVRQLEMEWMPLQVVDCKVLRNKRGEIVGEYTFRVLSGSATGMLVKKRLSRKACSRFAKELGFSNRYKQRKKSVAYFKEFGDFVGMRMVGLFDPALSITSPVFWHMGCTGGMKTYNRKLLKNRGRQDGFVCPMGYTHDCNKCPIGYDQCPAATHPRTYIWQLCKGCQEENWFDLKQNKDMCVGCCTKENLRT